MNQKEACNRALAALANASYSEKYSGSHIWTDMSTGEIEEKIAESIRAAFRQGPRPYWQDEADAAHAEETSS